MIADGVINKEVNRAAGKKLGKSLHYGAVYQSSTTTVDTDTTKPK